jgi:eukaryotic-like serine/threonine-protein kinase
LHARGLCYRDISFGNVFFDPRTGDVLICDNDNVGVDNGEGRVLGTPFFMAPEVVRDTTYNTLPTTDTDRHSLAVLLFYTLFMGHPLEGRLTQDGLRDITWLLRHFGTDPVFCMHPTRDDNRPPDIVRQYWMIYPAFIRDLFTQAFTDGLTEPTGRVTEGQWIKAMARLRDALYSCPTCGRTGFWDCDEPDLPCRSCGKPLTPPLVLHLGRRRLPVSVATEIRTDHLTRTDDPVVVGGVLPHPRERGRFGLYNGDRELWQAIYRDGVRRPVPPGETVELVHGLRLELRSTVLTVRRNPPNGEGLRSDPYP